MRFGAVILLCLAAPPVMAQSYSALELESWCKFVDTASIRSDGAIGIPLTENAGFCWAAFNTIGQLIGLVNDRGARTLKICAPPESTVAQSVKIFMRYVERHPEEAHLPFAPVALYALQEAFPCAASR